MPRRHSATITTAAGRRRWSMGFALWLALAFVLATGVGVALGRVPRALALYWLAPLAVWTLVLYGWDKRAAIWGRGRVSEKSLHLFALAGGWPGAVLGQRLFNHKTSKQPFRRIFWFTVVLNLTLFALALSNPGGRLLADILDASSVFGAMLRSLAGAL